MDQSVNELTVLLRKWEEEMSNPSYNPIPTLTKLCELFETESKNYLKKDPDPFDDRHPSRIDPTCILGQMYKILFRKDGLMNTLVLSYLSDHWPRRIKDTRDLNVVACRLLLNLLPGLDTTVVFQSPSNDFLIKRLFSWAESDDEPLRSYAKGLLASCMELTETATIFRDYNFRLVPKVLDRLHLLYTQFIEETKQSSLPFSHLNSDQSNDDNSVKPTPRKRMRLSSTPNAILFDDNAEDPQSIKMPIGDIPNESKENGLCGDSNSSWIYPESYANNWIQIYPLSLTTQIVYCLKYLIPTGEYQDFFSHAYEKNSLTLVMKIIKSSDRQNGYLTFEALKYLAALLCHKKFAIEFIASQGLQKLLVIPKPSIPAIGVSVCFYYLSYCEEAMERICLLPEHTLVDLVQYALWMLECSHDSSRCHATMFFSYSFQFRVILEIFDNHDGLRKLINVISTLPTVSPESPPLSDEAEGSARQMIRHVCASLKHYFEAHLHIKAEQIHRAKLRDSGLLASSSMVSTIPNYKSIKKSQAQVYEEIELLSNSVSIKSHWTPVDNLIKLGGINLIVHIISLAFEWTNVSGRCELIKNSLEVLSICAVLPKVQLALCEPFKTPREVQRNSSNLMNSEHVSLNNGFCVVIKAADGNLLDIDLQKAALSIIITCACAPIHRDGGSIAYYSTLGSTKKRTQKTNDEALIEKVWDSIRNSNGIMVLLTLMTIKTPITHVDIIRGLASRALAGIARSESVRQIISKLPLFNSGQLQNLMKNPILQERRQEHVKFQKYALELMELVSGKTNGAEIEASLVNINRANIVAQTKINFNEQQLLLLMHQHLEAKGLSKTAETLVQESNLNVAEKKTIPNVSHYRNRSVGGTMSPMSSRLAIINQKNEFTNSSNGLLGGFTRGVNSSSPIRLNVNRRSDLRPKPEIEPEFESPMSKLVHKKIDHDIPLSSDHNDSSTVSLGSIVTEYLTNQHASCKHPMVTCPQFNLFVPHKCPDPKPKDSMCTNFAMRFSKNIHSRKLNQRLIHSRFCPTRSFRLDTGEGYFTAAEFLNLNRVVAGTYDGDIKIYNSFNSQELVTMHAHESYIIHLECSNNGNLLISSSSWRTPLTKIWSLTENSFEMNCTELAYSLAEEEYCTFSNYDQTKLLGTRAEVASIYDVETRKKIMTLVPKLSNQYSRNRAVFDPTNELVLSDGVLWDATNGKEIHKFDKLNQNVSGIFHPNGLEIISNTEVWDMRTFQLLRTVSNLDQCSVAFSNNGEGMYVYVCDQELEDDQTYQTSFQTLDPHDYSNITTVDVKKHIYHIVSNKYDTQIAIVENQGIFDNIDESILRIYDVGRSRTEEDILEDEDDDDDDDDVDSDGGSSDDEGNLSSMYPQSLLDEMDILGDGLMEHFGRDNHFSSSDSSSRSSSESSLPSPLSNDGNADQE